MYDTSTFLVYGLSYAYECGVKKSRNVCIISRDVYVLPIVVITVPAKKKELPKSQ